MAKKIYVGNMNYNTSEDTLRQLFAQYGEVVSVNVITDRYTGRAKGFGFVEMASEDAARAAMTALNGREVDGRQLKVNEANDKPRDSNRSGGGAKPLLLSERPVRTGRRRSGLASGPGLPFRFSPLQNNAKRRVTAERGVERGVPHGQIAISEREAPQGAGPAEETGRKKAAQIQQEG